MPLKIKRLIMCRVILSRFGQQKGTSLCANHRPYSLGKPGLTPESRLTMTPLVLQNCSTKDQACRPPGLCSFKYLSKSACFKGWLTTFV